MAEGAKVSGLIETSAALFPAFFTSQDPPAHRLKGERGTLGWKSGWKTLMQKLLHT